MRSKECVPLRTENIDLIKYNFSLVRNDKINYQLTRVKYSVRAETGQSDVSSLKDWTLM